MKFSTRLPIAVHILLCLDVLGDRRKFTSNVLAGSVGVNPVVVRNILGQLKAAGLVAVEPGVGGARLTKDPAEITLLDILNAVEDDVSVFRMHEHRGARCCGAGHARPSCLHHLGRSGQRHEGAHRAAEAGLETQIRSPSRSSMASAAVLAARTASIRACSPDGLPLPYPTILASKWPETRAAISCGVSSQPLRAHVMNIP